MRFLARLSDSQLWVGYAAMGMGFVRGGTYFLTDPETGDVMYVGRSNNLTRRQAEHARSEEKGDLDFNVDKRTDSYAAQRGREQIIYDKYKPPLNQRLPIDPNNINRYKYMKAGRLLGGEDED